jgi:hypothetical protein
MRPRTAVPHSLDDRRNFLGFQNCPASATVAKFSMIRDVLSVSANDHPFLAMTKRINSGNVTNCYRNPRIFLRICEKLRIKKDIRMSLRNDVLIVRQNLNELR